MGRFEGPWFDCHEDRTWGRWMLPPYDNVFIGNDPTDGMTRKTVASFDAFVNVADTPCESLSPFPEKQQSYHWYPINEVGYWGLGVFYWTNTVLDRLISEKKVIYHHCHAGAHRSPITFFVYLLFKGYTMVEAAKILGRSNPDLEITRFFMDIRYGHISPYLFPFMEAQRRHPTYSFMGLLQYMRRDVWPQHEARELDPEIISTRSKPQYEREEAAHPPDGPNVDMKAAYAIMEPFLDEEAKEYVKNYNESGEWTPGDSKDLFSVAPDIISLEHVSKKPS